MAAILCFHGRLGWAKGGFICVSVFFTMSGFLITSLVLAERERSGRVDLPAFWARRARRLIPASIVALLLAAWVTVVVVPAAQRVEVAGDIRAAVLNFANWRFIAQGARYVDFSVVPSPVQHYWSLAIEEQFYLVFPVLAALALWRSRAALATCFTVLIAISFVQQIRLDDIDRVYFGTDTRLAEIAVGGLLALAYPRLRDHPALRRWHAGRRRRAGRPGRVHGDLPGHPARPHHDLRRRARRLRGGVVPHGHRRGRGADHAAHPRVPARRSTLGKISYGAYLYHFPLYLLLDEERVGLRGLRAVRRCGWRDRRRWRGSRFQLLRAADPRRGHAHGAHRAARPRRRVRRGAARSACRWLAPRTTTSSLAFRPVDTPADTSTSTTVASTGAGTTPVTTPPHDHHRAGPAAPRRGGRRLDRGRQRRGARDLGRRDREASRS